MPSEAPHELQESYRQYQAALKEKNALDFDDLLIKTVHLLKKHPEILDRLPWKYISVDEYQDTNRVQYEIIKLLSKRNNNICIIGDADQAIYAFRGANIQNFLNVGDDFPNVKILQLKNNYRSTPEIIKSARSIIQKNEDRMQVEIESVRDKGGALTICETTDEKTEAEFIVRTIEAYMGGTNRYEIEANNVDDKTDGYIFSDFAVLYRTHLQGKILEETFLKSGIPYQIVGAVPFYDRSEIKDMLAYTRAIYDPNDHEALLRIINKPTRGIGKTTIEKIEKYSLNEGIPFYKACEELDVLPIQDEQKNSLAEFIKLFESFRLKSTEISVSNLLKEIFNITGFKDLYKDKKRQDNIFQLIGFAVQFNELSPREGMKKFIEETAFMTDKDIYDDDKDTVTLLTLHASKGLEFPVVFIAGVEEDLIPYKHGEGEIQESEERRLFYVGMTRAKEKLYLLHTKKRLYFGEKLKVKSSRFLKDIPKEFIENQIHERKKRRIKKSDMDNSQMALW